jgi:hypothetical protein
MESYFHSLLLLRFYPFDDSAKNNMPYDCLVKEKLYFW